MATSFYLEVRGWFNLSFLFRWDDSPERGRPRPLSSSRLKNIAGGIYLLDLA